MLVFVGALTLLSSVLPGGGTAAAVSDGGDLSIAAATLTAEHVLDLPTGFQSGDEIGAAVAWENNLAVVGAPGDDSLGTDAGAVYVYDWVPGSSPVLRWKITPLDVKAGFEFGASVDIDAGSIAVGAPGANSERGRVYVFDFDSGTDSYSMLTYSAADGANFDRLGESVAISSNNVLAGAPGDDFLGSNDGSASLLTIAAGALTLTSQLGTGDDNAGFGSSVDIDHDAEVSLVVGSPNGNSGIGQINVYEDNFTDNYTVAPASGWDDFGFSVAIDAPNDLVVVGSPNTADGFGRAMIYRQAVEEFDHQPIFESGFGYDVSLNGPLATIGAPWSNNNSGFVGTWINTPDGVILQSAFPASSPGGLGGSSVASMGSTSSSDLMVGAPGGSTGDVGSFMPVDSFYELSSALVADAVVGTVQPTAVAIAGDVAVVGVPDYPSWWGPNSGGVFIYTRAANGPGWEFVKLVTQGAESGTWFGQSVDTDGTTVVVGAPDRDSGGEGGLVYTYRSVAGGAPFALSGILDAPVDDGAWLGNDVAIIDGWIVAGAPFDGTGANTANGSVHVFEPGEPIATGTGWDLFQTISGPPADWAKFGTSVALDGNHLAVSATSFVGGPTTVGPTSVTLFDRAAGTYNQVSSVAVPASSSGFGSDLSLGSRAMTIGQSPTKIHIYGAPEGWSSGLPVLLQTIDSATGFLGVGAVDGDGIVAAEVGTGLHLGLSNGAVYSTEGSLAPASTLNGSSVDLACNEVIVSTDSGAVIIEAAVDPIADPGGPYSVNEGGSVDLDASGSMQFSCGELTEAWSFESLPSVGSPSPSVNVGGGPAVEGVTLFVSDNLAQTSPSAVTQINIANAAPVVKPRLVDAGGQTPTVPVAGEQITVDLGTTDPGGDALTYTIDWGDGTLTNQAISGNTATHTYEFPGSYTINITATDSDGATSATAVFIEVNQRVESGYWMLGTGGQVHEFGTATDEPVLDSVNETAVDIEASKSGSGYWILTDDGVVHTRGSATHHGNVNMASLNNGELPVSISATPTGDGYWVFTTAGRAINFGAAVHHGDVSNLALNAPVIDSMSTTTGNGYYLVAEDGGVFSLGDAEFYGSTGALAIAAPVVTLAPDPDGAGYWLFAQDGGVFAFNAAFQGSVPGVLEGTPLNRNVATGIAFGDGYLLVARDGGIFNFSTRPLYGSTGATPPSYDIIGVAASRT